MKNAIAWCQKYEMLFRTIYEDDELREFFQKFNVYQPPQGHHGIYDILDECMHNAYEADVVVTDYGQIIADDKLSDKNVAKPSRNWVRTLSEEQIFACIAWHFRRDHFSEGSWIADSVANGHMLILVQGLLSKTAR